MGDLIKNNKLLRIQQAKAANTKERNIAKQYFNSRPSIGNLARAAYHWWNSVPGLGGEDESGNIIIGGEAPTPGMRNPKSIVKGVKPVIKIVKENAAKITPAQWTAAQDAAIARGDMSEALRLRDLHFETIGSPVRTQEGNMRLTHATKNKFNSFDLSKAGTGSGNTTNTEGVIHLSPYDDAALDVFKTKTIEERNAYNLMHLYANNPNPVEVPLKTFIKSWNDKESFKVLRDAGDGIIARGKSPYKLYKEKLAEYESKKSAGKLLPWTRKPESPKDFMEEAVVDGYTINNPANLKLADAVTYDDKGVRIPLGERDNFNINDIRYGLLPIIGGLGSYSVNKKKQGGLIVKNFKRKFLFGGKYTYYNWKNPPIKTSYGYPVYWSDSNNIPEEFKWVTDFLKNNPSTTGMAVGGGAQGDWDIGPRVIIRNSNSNIITDPNDSRWRGLDKIEAVRHYMNETNFNPYFKISPEQEYFRKTRMPKDASYNIDDDAWRQSIISRIIAGDMEGTPEQMKIVDKFKKDFLKQKGFWEKF